MIKKFLLFQICIIIILFANAAWCADKISGSACYTYGDNESLVQAEQMTKTLAIRNAIESYSTFIESTTQISDLQLSSDLINTVSAGQVKRIKILKRLQSGRKLCYTIEGFVEPNNLKTAIREYLSGKHRIATGRVKENEWIKIVNHFVWELTPEQFYKVGPDTPLAKMNKGKIFRKLWVQIEFLKPCTASTLFQKVRDQYRSEGGLFGDLMHPERKVKPLSPKSMAFLLAQINNMMATQDVDEKRRLGVWNDYEAHCKKYGIDPYEFMYDLYLPQFRCDDRLKVFVTFLSAGAELETKGEIPVADLINDKSEDRKTLMVPGERTAVIFSIPNEAESWEVWVPK